MEYFYFDRSGIFKYFFVFFYKPNLESEFKVAIAFLLDSSSSHCTFCSLSQNTKETLFINKSEPCFFFRFILVELVLFFELINFGGWVMSLRILFFDPRTRLLKNRVTLTHALSSLFRRLRKTLGSRDENVTNVNIRCISAT